MNYNFMSPEEIMERVIALETIVEDRAPLLDKLTETITKLSEILENIGEKE